MLYEFSTNVVEGKIIERVETPSQWRTAHISSIYKKINKKDHAKYRGLSDIFSMGRLYGRTN